jgi:NTP pyrophosphatase (non-canonical NTP hydrolase)
MSAMKDLGIYTYREVEMEIIRWSEARKIIPNSTPLAQTKKAMEEINELYDALIEGDPAKARDGVGDTVVCLINVCALMNADLVECLIEAYAEIKDRKCTLMPDGTFVKEPQ